MVLQLQHAVSEFVAEVGHELDALGNKGAGAYLNEVTREAEAIVASVLAADGRFTDSELDAYLDAVGPLLDPPLVTTAATLRDMGVLQKRVAWLDAPSVLFDLLASADAKSGGERAHRYYDRALRLAHVTAALDLVPSSDEIAAIDRFRTLLLDCLDRNGVRRPGHAAAAPSVTTSAASAKPPVAPQADLAPARSLDDLLDELDGLVGLASVKAEIRRLTSMLHVQQLRAERGLPVIETSHHLVFTGNPGTGKTTVARLLSQIYRAIGVVTEGQLVETDRSKLVAGYVGQTALKTQQALEASLGGMLLIDEAYALARGGDNDFGREAIDTLVKFMEDHRDDVAIVAAGYTDEMADFIDTNPGLKSRFTRTVLFPDYTDDELVEIFIRLGRKNAYECSDDALSRVRHLIATEPRTRGFGNARFVRNLFETAVAYQALRVSGLTDPSTEHLSTLVETDIAPVDQ